MNVCVCLSRPLSLPFWLSVLSVSVRAHTHTHTHTTHTHNTHTTHTHTHTTHTTHTHTHTSCSVKPSRNACSQRRRWFLCLGGCAFLLVGAQEPTTAVVLLLVHHQRSAITKKPNKHKKEIRSLCCVCQQTKMYKIDHFNTVHLHLSNDTMRGTLVPPTYRMRTHKKKQGACCIATHTYTCKHIHTYTCKHIHTSTHILTKAHPRARRRRANKSTQARFGL